MTKHPGARSVFVTANEQVISSAQHGNRVATITEHGLLTGKRIGRWHISIRPPNCDNRSIKRQHLHCSCGWSRLQPYPLVNGLIKSCTHVEALIQGEVFMRPPVPGDVDPYHVVLTRLGAQLFAWKIAEHALAESA